MKRIIFIFALVLLLSVIVYAALPAWLGCGAEPANKSTTTQANYSNLHTVACEESGEVTQIQAYLNTAGSGVQFAVLSKDGNNFTDDHYTSALATSTGLNTWNAPGDFTALPIEVGEYIGFHIEDNGLVDKATSGGTGYYYLSGDGIGDGDADGFTLSGNSSHDMQFRFYIESAGAPPTGRRERVTKLLGRKK